MAVRYKLEKHTQQQKQTYIACVHFYYALGRIHVGGPNTYTKYMNICLFRLFVPLGGAREARAGRTALAVSLANFRSDDAKTTSAGVAATVLSARALHVLISTSTCRRLPCCAPVRLASGAGYIATLVMAVLISIFRSVCHLLKTD